MFNTQYSILNFQWIKKMQEAVFWILDDRGMDSGGREESVFNNQKKETDKNIIRKIVSLSQI